MIRKHDVIKIPHKPNKPVAPDEIITETISIQLEAGQSLQDLLDFAKDKNPSFVRIRSESCYKDSWLDLCYNVIFNDKIKSLYYNNVY